MGKNFKSAFAAVLTATIAATLLPTETYAGPTSVAAREDVGLSGPIDQARYRRYVRRRHYYRYGYDPAGAAFAGAALGIMGAGIAAATAPRYYGWGPYYGYGWGYPGPYYGGWGW